MDNTLQEVKVKAKESFGDELEGLLVFGSRPRNEHREDSDIDLLVLFKHFVNKGKVDKFRNWFIDFQSEKNLLVDKQYPGEYISRSMLERSLLGYGFVIDDERCIKVNNLGSSDWNSFNEYRQWLACFSCPNKVLIGDPNKFDEYKARALGTVVIIVVNNLKLRDFDAYILAESLLSRGKEYLGFVDSISTRKYLENELPNVFERMVQDDRLIKNDERFNLNTEKVEDFLPMLTRDDDFRFKSNFVGKESTSETISYLKQSFDIGLKHITEADETINYKPEDEIKNQFTENIPQKGRSMNEILLEFKSKILDGSINQFNPNYIAFPDAGNAVSGLSADTLIPFINQNLISTTKSAPTGTFAEIQVINWIRELLGYQVNKFPSEASECAGMFVSGGVMANTIGLLAARCKTFPNSRSKGMSSAKVKPILIIAGPTVYHYSHIAAFWWLGMGEENIVYVKTTDKFRFDPKDLKEKIKKYNNGDTSKVVAVVCQAGDSRTTTIEDFETISNIVKNNGIWLHIDACHGGVMLFSSRLKKKLKGIENANSVSIDPHKGLCLTYPASMVLFKNVEDLKLLAKSTDITINKGSYDLGQITPFLGSKSFESLKLWFLIKNLGVEGIGKLVEYRYNLAESWQQSIDKSKYFVSLNSIELNSVVFSISPSKVRNHYPDKIISRVKLSELNKGLHNKVYADGHLCIHTFDFIDYPNVLKFDTREKIRVLGSIFGNPLTNNHDFRFIIEYMESLLEDLLANHF